MAEIAPRGLAPPFGVFVEAEESAFQLSAHLQQTEEFPKEGELVILYGSREMIISCVLKRAGILRTRLGNFSHEDIMKTRIGHKVRLSSQLSLPQTCL